MALTPEQRYDLVKRANAARLALGLEISHVSVSPWLLDREKLMRLFNDMCEVDRALCAEVDGPRPRPQVHF
jgi:hypothetical protein